MEGLPSVHVMMVYELLSDGCIELTIASVVYVCVYLYTLYLSILKNIISFTHYLYVCACAFAIIPKLRVLYTLTHVASGCHASLFQILSNSVSVCV